MSERATTKYRSKPKHHAGAINAPEPEEIAAVRNLAPQIANLRSNIGLLGKAFNVRTQTGFRFHHIVLSLRQHLDRLRNDDDGTGEVDRKPGGKYKLPACLLRKFRSDQPSLNNRKKAMPKILIVDDNRLHLACSAYSLRKHFLPENVFIATNGREALEIMEHVVIDAIFLDTEMPTMNGLEMADVVRHVETQLGQREFKTLIVGMLTPHEARNEDFLTDCLVAGMDRFCVKPLSVHMYAILDAITVSGSAVEGFRRKALELQWVSRHPELQQTLFGKQKADAKMLISNNNKKSSPASSATSSPKKGRKASISFIGDSSVNSSSGYNNNNDDNDDDDDRSSNNNNHRKMFSNQLSSDPDDIRRAQETALTLAPDLHDERQMLQLVEKDQRFAVEDIFARERREDTERMQHATALLRDRIDDLERQLAAVNGQKHKTMDSLHVETIAKLEKQAEDQRLQIMKLSVRNRELTKRNEKLEDDMRQIIRHGANNARTLRTAFRFIGQVQKKMEKYEQHSMMMEDRSANLSWQNFYGKHFQGTSSRRPLEMPEKAEDFSSSWYHEQIEESQRITLRSNETCASAVVMLGELLDHVHLVRPSMFTSPMNSASSFAAVANQNNNATNTFNSSQSPSPSQQSPANGNTPSASSLQLVPESSAASSASNALEKQQQQQQPTLNSATMGSSSNASAEQSAWKTLQRDIEVVIHNLTTMLMQNVKDLTEGTKRNSANVVVRELELWKRLARFDKEEDGKWMDLSPKVQDEIHAIVQRMQLAADAKQRRSEVTQTESFEAPPWVTNDFGTEFASLIQQQNAERRNRRNSISGGSEMSFMTEVSLQSKSFNSGNKKELASAAAGSKEWTFTALMNKLRPMMMFEGFVPLDVRQRAFEKILESIFRLEKKQNTDLGDATKRLIKEVRHHYTSVEDGDEKQRVLLLGDVAARSNLHFREILKILANVSDNLAGVVDAVIVHTLKSIEPNSGNTRVTKERGLALALLEALESADQDPPLLTPWGEPALTHKVRAGETWESLEKSFGCSQVEMRRMNATVDPPIDFDVAPEPGLIVKLPSRPEYIRGKFAHLYHPKTTFSKSGAGDRTRLNREPSNFLRGSSNLGGGSRLLARDSTLNPNMFTRSNDSRRFGGEKSSFLGVPGGMGGRSSTMMGGRHSTMRMATSRGPSRMASTRAPSQMNMLSAAHRKRGSIVGETINHFEKQAKKVGATNRERVNARVAQSILTQSKGSSHNNKKGSSSSPSASPTDTKKRSSSRNHDGTTDSLENTTNEISLAIPGGETPKQQTTKELLHNLFDDSKKKQQPEVYNVSVKVLPTEAPKRISEFAEEYGVTEQDIRDANPHLMMTKKNNNSNNDDNSGSNPLSLETSLALNADDELQIPVKREFIVKSLTEERDSRLGEAMKKFLEAAAAKQEADDAERDVHDSKFNNNNPSSSKNTDEDNNNQMVRQDSSFAEKFERSKSKALLAANAAMESQEAADHAAALHRALIDHLEHLGESNDGNDDDANNNPEGHDGGDSQSGGSQTTTTRLNPFSGIRGASLRKTKLSKVVVDMPVKVETSFEKLAVLYGIKGEDLVRANPSLSNPIAAGEVLKIPVNILEWRERVAKAATDAQTAAEVGVGLTTVESMYVEDGEDVNSNLAEGHNLDASLSGSQQQLPALGSQSGNTMLAALLADGKETNAWTRGEKALFNSVSAALKQKSLSVVIEHQETEYGVTLETIAEEYGCGEVLHVEKKFALREQQLQQSRGPSVARRASSQQPTNQEKSDVVANNNNNKEALDESTSSQHQQLPPKMTESDVNNNSSTSDPKKRHSIVEETSSNSTQIRQEQNKSFVQKEKAEHQLFMAEKNKAVAEATKEIEKHNIDSGAIIHDDDDDNSVNPNIPLKVPVPLESIIRKEMDFTLDLQQQCMELAHSLRRQQFQQDNDDDFNDDDDNYGATSESPEEIYTGSLNPPPVRQNQNNNSGIKKENSLSQFTVGGKSNDRRLSRQLTDIKLVKGDSSLKLDTNALTELCNLEDLVARHQDCIQAMLQIYFDKIREKLKKPSTAEISVMTDNVSNILLSSGLHHQRHKGSSFFDSGNSFGGGINNNTGKRHAADSKLFDENDRIILQEQEHEKQLAAAAVLLGVEDISQVPAALRNARFSSVASSFLERLKKSYPIASAALDRSTKTSRKREEMMMKNENIAGVGGASTIFSTNSGSPHLQSASLHTFFGSSENPSPGRQMLGMTNIDSLKIVGAKAGAKYDPDEHLENYPRRRGSHRLGASFISGYANHNSSTIGDTSGMIIAGRFNEENPSSIAIKRKPKGLRGSQSARMMPLSSNTKNQYGKNFFDEKDLLRQRMQRLGFTSSAEALSGDSELVARLQNTSASPLVREGLTMSVKGGQLASHQRNNKQQQQNDDDENNNIGAHHEQDGHHTTATKHNNTKPRFLDDDEERTNRYYQHSTVVQRAAHHFGGGDPHQRWGGASSISGNTHQSPTTSTSAAVASSFAKSTPLPNNNNHQNTKVSPLPPNKFQQQKRFNESITATTNNDDDELDKLRKEGESNSSVSRRKSNAPLIIRSPAPPGVGSPTSNEFLLANSQSPRVLSQSYRPPKDWKSKVGTGDRKVEMYAEDRKGAIDRFTTRLFEITDDSKKSPKKFASSPTSLAGGTGSSSARGSPGKAFNVGGGGSSSSGQFVRSNIGK